MVLEMFAMVTSGLAESGDLGGRPKASFQPCLLPM